MQLVGEKGQASRTLFQLHNPSTAGGDFRCVANFPPISSALGVDSASDGRARHVAIQGCCGFERTAGARSLAAAVNVIGRC
jgi:hypothetical protein